MPLSPGDKLGRYELLAPIGKGGMGEVWRARDPRLNRDVAIKSSLVGLERFQKEAEAIAALNHPHICQIYDVGPDYLVMEFIDGKPLSDQTQAGPLPLENALLIAAQIAGALEAAHSKGILHRDLKPANVLVVQVNSQPCAKLLDFGLAKMMLPADEEVTGKIRIGETIDGAILGTASYMSPEQAQGKPIDERSDIFSFGAVLYELLSGKQAFGGGSLIDVLSAVVRDDPAPFESPAAAIVTRCLSKRREDRFQSVAELKTALEKLALAKPAGRSPSIAVLPFANMSASKDDEYFSDGLAEEILNLLVRIPELKVTARTSSFAFRGKEQDITGIAAKLHVSTILEGSVRRSGSRIRVTAQLINATDGYHLWSERYDREMTDVFAVQDEIAAAIAQALRLKFSQNVAGDRHQPGVPAYEAFLKGRHMILRSSPETLDRARQYFEQAILLDPEYADPYAELGQSYALFGIWGNRTASEMLPLARAMALKARDLAPRAPRAHAVLAQLAAFYEHDWKAAAGHIRQARAAGNLPVEVALRCGLAGICQGFYPEAIREFESTLEQDPLSALFRSVLAMTLALGGYFDRAIGEAGKALEIETFWIAWFAITLSHISSGRFEEACEAARKAVEAAPWNGMCAGLLAGLYARQGDHIRATALLAPHGDGLPAMLRHVVCGEVEAAAGWCEKALDRGEAGLALFVPSALFKAFRESSGWPAIANRMNLPVILP
ncbi:MAG TPA: protein kinase [Bryobacteraceae bacterium]|jgi:serine/threonine-protein kinase|nr:protein kinase [Bryobacteraceae bacterium]